MKESGKFGVNILAEDQKDLSDHFASMFSQTAFSTDRALFARLFHALLRRGVYLPPSALESWFVSAVHSESHIENTLEAFTPALEEAL